jgi:hypothetical protein
MGAVRKLDEIILNMGVACVLNTVDWCLLIGAY